MTYSTLPVCTVIEEIERHTGEKPSTERVYALLENRRSRYVQLEGLVEQLLADEFVRGHARD